MKDGQVGSAFHEPMLAGPDPLAENIASQLLPPAPSAPLGGFYLSSWMCDGPGGVVGL